jgi:hypothetical protein
MVPELTAALIAFTVAIVVILTKRCVATVQSCSEGDQETTCISPCGVGANIGCTLVREGAKIVASACVCAIPCCCTVKMKETTHENGHLALTSLPSFDLTRKI